MQNEEIKLKACPFCDGDARLWVWSEGGGVCVRCTSCWCQTATRSDDALLRPPIRPAVERVIEEWNRRAKDAD